MASGKILLFTGIGLIFFSGLFGYNVCVPMYKRKKLLNYDQEVKQFIAKQEQLRKQQHQTEHEP